MGLESGAEHQAQHGVQHGEGHYDLESSHGFSAQKAADDDTVDDGAQEAHQVVGHHFSGVIAECTAKKLFALFQSVCLYDAKKTTIRKNLANCGWFSMCLSEFILVPSAL